MRNKVKVLVVGQTPPPFLGQAMMIDRLVKGKFENVSIFHVRMAFSDNLQAIGKFKFKKLTHLLYVVLKTIQMRFKHNVSILYYPPSGPHRVPLMRDLMILFCIRPFFKKTIFHYRAAGVSQLLERSTPVIRFLGKKIYNHPHGAIQQSILNPADGKYFHARKTFIIKNGLEDAAAKYLPLERHPSATLKILFVGAMYKERGILVLLEAAKLLKESGIPFRAVCVGDFATPAFGVEAKEQCRAYGLREQFLFPGSKIGDAKWHEYLTADVFCFPSFVESESFGNVIAEAMMFSLPVIATKWNAIPELVEDGVTGYLVPVEDAVKLAEKIKLLAENPALRIRLGSKGREKFISEFLLDTHLNNMEKMFVEVAAM